MSWQQDYKAKRDEEDDLITGHVAELEGDLALARHALEVRKRWEWFWGIIAVIADILLIYGIAHIT